VELVACGVIDYSSIQEIEELGGAGVTFLNILIRFLFEVTVSSSCTLSPRRRRQREGGGYC
jgi:hypothetical protein